MKKIRFYFYTGEYVEYEDGEDYNVDVNLDANVILWSSLEGQLLFLAKWSDIEYVEAIDQTPEYNSESSTAPYEDEEPVLNTTNYNVFDLSSWRGRKIGPSC